MVFQLHDFVHYEVTLFAIVSFLLEIYEGKKETCHRSSYERRGHVGWQVFWQILCDRCDSFPFIQWFWARTEEKVSRLIGTHQLIHLNYYPYIARLKNISLLITLILELLKTKIKILQAPGPSPVRIHKITFIFCASCSWDGSPRLPGAGSQGDHQQLRHWEEFLWGDGCRPECCEGVMCQVL